MTPFAVILAMNLYLVPVFRPTLELIQAHQVVSVVESHEGAETKQPDGVEILLKLHFN